MDLKWTRYTWTVWNWGYKILRGSSVFFSNESFILITYYSICKRLNYKCLVALSYDTSFPVCLFDIESAPCRSTQSYVWSPLKEVFCVQICSMSSHLCFVSIYLKYLSDIFFPPGIQVTSDLPYFHSAPTLALSKCHSLCTTKAGNWKI